MKYVYCASRTVQRGPIISISMVTPNMFIFLTATYTPTIKGKVLLHCRVNNGYANA
jgi:hypothetical protein